MKVLGIQIPFTNKDNTQVRSLSLTNPSKELLRMLGVETNSVTVNTSNSLGLTAFWAAINLISNTIAGLPVKVHKKKTDSEREAIAHQASYLLSKKPNGLMIPFMFKYMMMARALVEGNAIARIIRDSETAEAIALMPVTESFEILVKDNQKYFKIHNSEELIKDDDIFHIMGMTLNGISGISVISHHGTTLGLNLAAQKYAENTYKKGTHLKGYITTDKELGKLAVDNLKKSWSNKYAGPDGDDVAILDLGLNYKTVSMSLQDAQIIETRKYGVEDIARIFSVPPHKIGDLSKSTNNNIEHQSIEFVQDCIMYWAMRWEQEADSKLLKENEKKKGNVYTNFELKGLMRGDSKSRIELIRGMVEIGAMSPNVALQLEDMNTFDGGDVRTVQMNRIPIDQLSEFTTSMINRNSQTQAKGNEDTNIDNNNTQ